MAGGQRAGEDCRWAWVEERWPARWTQPGRGWMGRAGSRGGAKWGGGGVPAGAGWGRGQDGKWEAEPEWFEETEALRGGTADFCAQQRRAAKTEGTKCVAVMTWQECKQVSVRPSPRRGTWVEEARASGQARQHAQPGRK